MTDESKEAKAGADIVDDLGEVWRRHAQKMKEQGFDMATTISSIIVAFGCSIGELVANGVRNKGAAITLVSRLPETIISAAEKLFGGFKDDGT